MSPRTAKLALLAAFPLVLGGCAHKVIGAAVVAVVAAVVRSPEGSEAIADGADTILPGSGTIVRIIVALVTGTVWEQALRKE